MTNEPPKQPTASQNAGGFLLNVNLVFASNMLTYGLAFLIVVVIARALGPEGRGVTALYQLAVALAYAVLSLGVSVAAVYFVSKRAHSVRQSLEAGLSVTLAAAVVTAVAVVVITPFAGDRLRGADIPYWMAVLIVPALIQFHLLEEVLRAQYRFLAMNAVTLAQPVVILILLLIVDAVTGLTIGWTVTLWSLAALAPTVAGYALLDRDDRPRGLAGSALLKETIHFGVQGQAGNLVQLLNYRLDSYLVLLFVNTAGVGLYAVGVAMSEGLWFIANAVGTVLLPGLTAADDAEAARRTPLICRNTIFVTAIAAIGLAALSPVLVPVIFGEAFEDSVLPFLWLLPGTVALSGAKILAAYVFSRGRPLINTSITLATFVLTIIGDILLIPRFEVAGAAVASSIAYTGTLVLTALAYRRLSGGSLSEALIPRPSDLPLYIDSLRALAGRLRSSRHVAALR